MCRLMFSNGQPPLPRRVIAAHLPAVFLLATACAADSGSSQGDFVQRDSLGITIYESRRLGPRVEATEELRIGAVDGPPETTFNRITDARLDRDGGLVVLDGGDHLIKLFDETGAPLRTMGGEGEGPAEFQAASNLALSGDTLWVLDWRLRKVVRFHLNGALLDTRRIEFTPFQHGFATDFTPRSGGRFFIVGTTGCALPRGPNDNLWRLYTIGTDGKVQDTLMRHEMANALSVYATSGQGGSCTNLPWPFEPAHTLAFDPRGGAFRSAGAAFEIIQLDTTLTRVRTIIRHAAPEHPVTATDRQAFQDRLDARETTADLRRAVQHAVDSTGYPETWPAVTALRVGSPGTVWAQRAGPMEAEHQEWDVLVDGRHARTVVLPGTLRVTDVRGNRILGVLTDELDVQYVAVFSVPPLNATG
jgi:hypothetical protein